MNDIITIEDDQNNLTSQLSEMLKQSVAYRFESLLNDKRLNCYCILECKYKTCYTEIFIFIQIFIHGDKKKLIQMEDFVFRITSHVKAVLFVFVLNS